MRTNDREERVNGKEQDKKSKTYYRQLRIKHTYKRWRATARERDFLPMVRFSSFTYYFPLFRSLALSHAQSVFVWLSLCCQNCFALRVEPDTLCQCLVIRVFSIGYYSRARLFVRSWLSWTRLSLSDFRFACICASSCVCIRSHVFIAVAHAYACLCMGLCDDCVLLVCVCVYANWIHADEWITLFRRLLAIRSNACVLYVIVVVGFFFRFKCILPLHHTIARTVQCNVIIIAHATKHGRIESSQI